MSPFVVCRHSHSIFVQFGDFSFQRTSSTLRAETRGGRAEPGNRYWRSNHSCSRRAKIISAIWKMKMLVVLLIGDAINQTNTWGDSIVDHGVKKNEESVGWWEEAEDGTALPGPLIPHRWPFVVSATGGPQWKQAEHVWPHSKHFPWRVCGLEAKQGGHVGGERKSKPRPSAGALEINNQHRETS